MVDEEAEISVPARLSIRRNEGGAVRTDPGKWKYFGEFIWEDGNYSCDCNREMFWLRAAGESVQGRRQCTLGRYSIRLIAIDDGRVLYEDGDW